MAAKTLTRGALLGAAAGAGALVLGGAAATRASGGGSAAAAQTPHGGMVHGGGAEGPTFRAGSVVDLGHGPRIDTNTPLTITNTSASLAHSDETSAQLAPRAALARHRFPLASRVMFACAAEYESRKRSTGMA